MLQKFGVQGDIPLIKISKEDVSVSYKPIPREGFVVAEGVLSGHHHKIVADKESVVEIAKDSRGYFVKVLQGSAQLVHQEHDTQKIGVGIWFVGQEREYDEIAERKVLD